MNLQESYTRWISEDANCVGMEATESDTATIKALCEFAGLRPSALAKRAGLAATTITRTFNGEATTQVSLPTWQKLRAAFPDFPGWPSASPDEIPTPPDIAYESIDVLPTFAGMGGGGNGDGEPERALVPRYLIRDVLRGQPQDFVLVRVRGTSMEPMFRQDDELLIDKRDRSPTQPGPFCLWDGQWGEYVVKNVERLPGNRLRVFSENGQFSGFEVDNEETTILGRPVWFGRRL